MKGRLIFILLFSISFYDGFSGNSSRMLATAAMQHDLSILQSAWIHLHPGLYRYNTPAQIDGYFDTLRHQCSVSMDERRFYILLSQLAQKVKCGHTYLNPLNLDTATQKRILPSTVIPLFFQIADGKIVVTSDLSENKMLHRGDEIQAINGIAAKRIIDSLLTVSRSDGNNSIGKKINNINETADEADSYSLFDIYFPLFFPSATDAYILTLKPFGGKVINTVRITALSPKSRIDKYEKKFGKVPVLEKSWDYHIIGQSNAYMKFGTFAFWNSDFDERKFVDSVFHDLSQHPAVTGLVIDIRSNEGGDNTGDYILSHITTQKIGCEDPDRPCYRFQTIPDSLLPYLSTWDNSFKKPKDTSRFFKNEIGLYEVKANAQPCDYIQPAANGFKGKVILLINAKNSSAGYEMARNFKTYHLGKVVGETTGGSQQGINGGEFFFLTLPESKFEIDLPLIYNYHPGKEDKGISPDQDIPTTQESIYRGEDPQLKFALKLLAE